MIFLVITAWEYFIISTEYEAVVNNKEETWKIEKIKSVQKSLKRFWTF